MIYKSVVGVNTQKGFHPTDYMKSPRSDIENWWAAEAMIASYNHVYQVAHKTEYKVHGPIGVSIYESAPIASYQYEFLALSADVQSVMDAVLAYPVPDDKHYIINAFHPAPSNRDLKEQYTKFAHEFVRTGPIIGFDLPEKATTIPSNVHRAATIQQAETANHNLTTEGERIYVQTLRDEHIHTFYVEHEGEAVGWLQLVSIYENVGYINQLYVLKNYRKLKYGTALVQHAHAQGIKLGLKCMVAIPSDQAMHLYRRLGYKPLLYFSAFQPNGGYHE